MLSYGANFYTFRKFGISHIFPILLLIFILLVTVKYKRNIKRNNLGRWIALFFTFLACTLQLVYIIWSNAFNANWAVTLFPFCATWLGIITAVILYITKNEKVFDIFFFISIYSIINLIYPNFGKYSIDHFRYYHFFITNMYLVWSLVYFIVFEKYSVNIKSVLYENVFFIIFLFCNYLMFVFFGIDNSKNILDFMSKYLTKANIPMLNSFLYIFIANVIVSIVSFLPWVIKKNIDDKKVRMYE